MDTDNLFGTQTALIYTMVLVSASDSRMSDRELQLIGRLVEHTPAFEGFDPGLVIEVAAGCAGDLDSEDGLERTLDEIKRAIEPRFRETAYALACEIAAVDGKVRPEESRMLEMLRHSLELDRLIAAAIERGTRARYMR